MSDYIGDYTTRGGNMSSPHNEFIERWFEDHDIMGELEAVQYDELLLQYLNDHKPLLKEWLDKYNEARLVTPNSNPIEDMPQFRYRELILWFRESQIRVDHWNKWLEARIPEPIDYDDSNEAN